MTVDDSPLARAFISATAESLGFRVVEAASGDEALAVLREHGEDIVLVLLDWRMPGMSGIDMLEAMKADSRLVDIPVMMVTALAGHDCAMRALAAGAASYLVKPFSPETLTAEIRKALDHRQHACRYTREEPSG